MFHALHVQRFMICEIWIFARFFDLFQKSSSSEHTITSSKFISLMRLERPVKSSRYLGFSEVCNKSWKPFWANSSSTFWLQAVQLENLWVVGLVKWKLLMEPRKEWNVSPSGPSSVSRSEVLVMLAEAIKPFGCCKTEAWKIKQKFFWYKSFLTARAN